MFYIIVSLEFVSFNALVTRDAIDMIGNPLTRHLMKFLDAVDLSWSPSPLNPIPDIETLALEQKSHV
jgi:hypothetical protein